MSESVTTPQTRSMGPVTVAPQQVTDPTILDSVAGFINEVVPTNHNGHFDAKDQIQWARFEQIDSEESHLLLSYESDKIVPPAVILLLGYTTGIQVWAVPANGEAVEILSWRHGSVRILKILPTPYLVSKSNKLDVFFPKRPLLAICDSSSSPQFSSINLLSLKTGEQVKVIKFKNPVLDVLANKRSVVVTFQEKIAIFDAFNFEDRLTVTTCYLSPGLNPNPVTLGSRWMAYAEKKLNASKRSSGGNEGEGVQSYTATVLHAAKSLGRGLRELGESVASSLTGNPNYKPGTSPNSPQAGGMSDIPQKGIVTIMDIESPYQEKLNNSDPIIAHFTAHTEAIVYLQFDPSGMLLFTADKRGHDFHLFRIQSHMTGPALAAVHHLYILHRGDTSARVQDMCFSPDSRWAAVSTLRGTTHVFPITPYGGNVGVRTHATPHVVNKMSRFHRSAGLTVDGRSNSPVSMFEAPTNSHFPFNNPRFPPYPHPTVIHPLAQIRQPVYIQNIGGGQQRQQPGRQRLSSSSEDNVFLRVVACFAPPRAWLGPSQRETQLVIQTKPQPVESLFIISCHGTLVQYDLDPHQASNVPKERVSSDTPIELTVTAKAQWLLQRHLGCEDILPPMSAENLSYVAPQVIYKKERPEHNEDGWLSQVEIITHAGPHRRLWMGPQFTFKTYTTSTGSISEAQPIDLGQTKPVNMPITKANAVLIESSSASSCEQALLDNYRKTCEEGGAGESQLKEDLADAMLESPSVRETGGRCVIVQMKPAVAKVVNPLGTVVNVHSDEETDIESCEENVIHENCDEALFRPVVAPKAVLSNERTKRYGDEIITKSLETTTEVAVKILKKSSEIVKSKSREASPKKVKGKPEEKKGNEVDAPVKPAKNRNKPEPKIKLPIAEPFIDICDEIKSTNTTKHRRDVQSIPIPEPLEKIETILHQENKDVIVDFPPLEYEDFFSLENTCKPDDFEDARENLLDTSNKKKSKPKKEKEDASDPFEDKITHKKNRKPKPKLGVKIVNNENLKPEKVFEDCTTEISLPLPAKKSWSAIAASKPTEKSLIDTEETEKPLDLDLPPIEFVEEFTVRLPSKITTPCITSDLIDINTPQEEREDDVPPVTEDLLKIDKSSDDEKAESNSSQAEVTESSDDSGKIPDISAVFEDLNESKTTTMTSKTAKRKKKRK